MNTPLQNCGEVHAPKPTIDDGDQRKASLRAILRQARRKLLTEHRHHEEAATAAALERLARLRRNCAAYAATGGELDLGVWLESRWNNSNPVWLPRVTAAGLTWHLVVANSQLITGYREILEPDPRHCPAQSLPADVLMLVPGVGFAPGGWRLGQGGGFYDRILAIMPARTLTIGVALSCQWCPTLPRTTHDQPCAAILVAGQLHPGHSATTRLAEVRP